MNKRSFDDIIPPDGGKKSIRNIPVPKRKENKIDELLVETADFRAAQHRRAAAPDPRKIVAAKVPSQEKKTYWSFFIAAMVIIAGVEYVFVFNRADVTISLNV
jgi:hypothetical protein